MYVQLVQFGTGRLFGACGICCLQLFQEAFVRTTPHPPKVLCNTPVVTRLRHKSHIGGFSDISITVIIESSIWRKLLLLLCLIHTADVERLHARRAVHHPLCQRSHPPLTKINGFVSPPSLFLEQIMAPCKPPRSRP